MSRQLALGLASRTEERFRAFHSRHPEIYSSLCDKARLLKGRGHTFYSINALISIVRFHADVRTDMSARYKIGNDYAPHYARLIMAQEKDLAGFFKTNALKGEARI